VDEKGRRKRWLTATTSSIIMVIDVVVIMVTVDGGIDDKGMGLMMGAEKWLEVKSMIP
jgi:hypothetical protein